MLFSTQSFCHSIILSFNLTFNMKRKPILLSPLLLILSLASVSAQTISRELMEKYTSQWKGERYDDGRPKVPDRLLERAKDISIEEAWGVLRNEGYENQFEGNWKMIHDDVPVVGRALTAQYLPARPDMTNAIEEQGKADGRIGSSNSWPIDELQMGDVYVADGYGKIVDGTLIGDNLGNSIYAKSGNGVVFDGSLRDLGGLSNIEGFNAFVRGWDPSFIKDMMLGGLNTPIRIGRATVLPGDVVLAKREGRDLHSGALGRESDHQRRIYCPKRPVRSPDATRGQIYARPD